MSETLEAGLTPCSAFIRARGGAACRPFSFSRCSCFRGAKSSAGRQAHISGLVRVRRVRAPERSEGKPRRSALRAVLRGAVRETVGCADYAPLAACTSFPYALRMFAPLSAVRRIKGARVVHKSGIVSL